MRITNLFVPVFFVAWTACGGKAQLESEAFHNDILVQDSFELPADGTPNDNGTIGPFCCTGTTAIIESVQGYPVGYAYFYGWGGQAYNYGDTSIAPSVEILVAGLADIQDPESELLQEVIRLDAKDMQPGATGAATAGQLKFVVTIDEVDIVMMGDQPYFDMGSLTVHLDVSPVT